MSFAWERLIGLIAEGKVVPIIGQDLLRTETPAGPMPVYRYIATRVAERLGVAPPLDDTPNPLHDVATRYLERGGDWLEIYSTVCEVMPALDTLPAPAALVDLAKIIPLSLFVTTTFDSLLERTLNRERYGGERLTRTLTFTPGTTEDLPEGRYDAATATVFHLFGRCSMSPDYAVTEEDTLEFMHLLQSDVKRPQNLFAELSQRDLLLIGNSFSDWVSRFFMRSTKQERIWMTATRNRFVADDRVRNDAALLQFYRPSPYVKVYADGSPQEFVADLRRRWEERVRLLARDTGEGGQGESPLEIAPGFVFISYARQDIAFATAVADALRRMAIKVWFDKTDLVPGDDYEEKIKAAIPRSAVFVPILSERAVGADRRYLFREWRKAIDAAESVGWNSNFIMPIALAPLGRDDDRLPPEFRQLHWPLLERGAPPPKEWLGAVQKAVRQFHKASKAGIA
jgi:TIR domain/SIR2-like domain